jgi:hypothetical protein
MQVGHRHQCCQVAQSPAAPHLDGEAGPIVLQRAGVRAPAHRDSSIGAELFEQHARLAGVDQIFQVAPAFDDAVDGGILVVGVEIVPVELPVEPSPGMWVVVVDLGALSIGLGEHVEGFE